MSALRLSKIQDFPFIDRPLGRAVADGIQLLDELGAIETEGENNTFTLTNTGKALADLPLDPRIGRI